MVRTVSTHFSDAAIVLPILTHLQRKQFKCRKIFFDKHIFMKKYFASPQLPLRLVKALQNIPKDVQGT